jgi:hypothetical protein
VPRSNDADRPSRKPSRPSGKRGGTDHGAVRRGAGKKGPPRKGGKGGKEAALDVAPVRRVGEPKGEHGTLTSRRVRCIRCKKVEHIQGAPRDRTLALCRSCAEEVLHIYEAGALAKPKPVEATCAQCGVKFELPITARERLADEEVLCRDCLRGFASWQGPIDRPATREKELGEPRRPGVRLRKH